MAFALSFLSMSHWDDVVMLSFDNVKSDGWWRRENRRAFLSPVIRSHMSKENARTNRIWWSNLLFGHVCAGALLHLSIARTTSSSRSLLSSRFLILFLQGQETSKSLSKWRNQKHEHACHSTLIESNIFVVFSSLEKWNRNGARSSSKRIKPNEIRSGSLSNTSKMQLAQMSSCLDWSH